MKYKSVTGTRDVLPDEQPYWRIIEEKIDKITRLYGYEQVNPPVFEQTELFVRGVGETTDIVEKEMYTFLDKGKNSLTLRPEFTAGIMRLYLQNGLHTRPKPVKLFSIGPIFRYERPQAGRFRQHTQFDVEALGEQDPAVDLEVMSIAWQLYAELGFKGLAFQLNSTGCPVCRPGYVATLTAYYQKRFDEICGDCKRRLQSNPLRLLDCKNETCQPIILDAPVISRFLCGECKEHFETLRRYLDALERSYTINHKLVRGLDYYTKTVFEVWAEGIGAQNAMCGGGRYDGLVEQLGGPPTPGIGFGSGIERIILSMKQQGLAPAPEQKPDVFLVSLGQLARMKAIPLLYKLRENELAATTAFGDKSFKTQMRDADRQGARYALILGENELAAGIVAVKNLGDGVQENVPEDRIVSFLLEKIKR